MTANNYGRVFIKNIRFDLAPIYVSLCVVYGLAGFSVAAIASEQGVSFPTAFWVAMRALPALWVATPFSYGAVAVINEWRGEA